MRKYRYISNRKNFEKALAKDTDGRLERMGLKIVEYIFKSFKGSSSKGTYVAGRWVAKTFIKRSSPGEPPYVQTSRLRDNVISVLDKSRLLIGVRNIVDYAFILEVGGSTGKSYIKPRPYLRPSIKWAQTNFKRIFR